MEIEKKYLIDTLPDLTLAKEVKSIEQGYIAVSPVIRIRKANDQYYLTCKGKGLMAREEFEILISQEEYSHLKTKLDTIPIIKKRYLIPLDAYTIELDIFQGHLEGLILAEVEFPSIEAAELFVPPIWFGKEVTMDYRFQNNQLSGMKDLSQLDI